MNTWFYRHAEQAVGPFDRDVLDKLKGAGVIDDATPVKNSEAADWLPFGSLNAQKNPTPGVPPPPAPPPARYYYLDANRQPVGPFDLETLGRLHAQHVLSADSLVSGIGDQQWVPASQILGLSRNGHSAVSGFEPEAVQTLLPVRRNFDQFALMMGCTLTFYTFYLIPSYSRDMRAITGKPRMEFNPMLILGIVTLGLSLVVTMVLWAFELERQGKAVGKAGRQEFLGPAVLALNIIALICCFAIDNFVLSFIVGGGFATWAVWLLQREINLYAPISEPS
jgi:hypothetical protein